MHLLVWWTLASLFVGFLGRKRRFGFWGYSVFAFIFTPLVAAVALLFAAPRRPKVVAKPPLSRTAAATIGRAAAPVRGSVSFLPIVTRLVIGWALIIVVSGAVLKIFGGMEAKAGAQFSLETATFARTETERLQQNPMLEMAVVNLERVFVLLLFAWAISRFLERLAEYRIARVGSEVAGQSAERISDLESRLNQQQHELERLRAQAGAPPLPSAAVTGMQAQSAPN